MFVNKNILRVSATILPVLFFCALFLLSFSQLQAQNIGNEGDRLETLNSQDDTGGTMNTDGGSMTRTSADSQKLTNPLGSKTDTIPTFLLKVIDVLLTFATPIIILYIMYAGFLFVTARGNSEQISTARSALLWAIVGGVIVLGAKLIIEVVQGTVKGLGGA